MLMRLSACIFTSIQIQVNNTEITIIYITHGINKLYNINVCLNSGILRDGGRWDVQTPPEIPEFWRSRTGLQIERKMFSVPIPAS